MEQFLSHRPGLATMINKMGSTCAHIAAVKGSVAVIKELLKFDKENVIMARHKVTINQFTCINNYIFVYLAIYIVR